MPRRPTAQIPLGVADLPEEQRRAALTWDLHDGHLAVVGGPRSGRTTALRAVVAGLARLDGVAHVHVLTGPGEAVVPTAPARSPDITGDLPDHRRVAPPWLGSVVTVEDVDRAARLLRHLATAPVRARWTVLVVDGWESVAQALQAHDRARPFDQLVALARDRGADGLRLVAAGGRSLLTGVVGTLLPTRLLLRTADPTDLLVAGLGSYELPSFMPPGRVLRLGAAADGSRSVVEAQVGLLDRDPAPQRQAAALLRLGRVLATGPRDVAEPLRLVPLPTVVGLADLDCAPRTTADTRDQVCIGLGGDEGAPVGLPLPAGMVVLVAGPPGSGRSTALRTVGTQAARAGRAIVRAGPAGVTPMPPAGAVILVDDVDRLPAIVHEEVEALVVAGATAVVVATSADAAVAFRGLLAATRRSRCGLLLGACGPGESEILGVSCTPPRNTIPGRGIAVDRGRATPVQVACSGAAEPGGAGEPMRE